MNKKLVVLLLALACALIYTGRTVMLQAGRGIDTYFFWDLAWFLLLFSEGIVLFRHAQNGGTAWGVAAVVCAGLTLSASAAALAFGIAKATPLTAVSFCALVLTTLALLALFVLALSPQNGRRVIPGIVCAAGAVLLLLAYDVPQMVSCVREFSAGLQNNAGADSLVFYAIFALLQVAFSVLAHGVAFCFGWKAWRGTHEEKR